MSRGFFYWRSHLRPWIGKRFARGYLLLFICTYGISLSSSAANAGTLQDQIKRLTSMLSNRNIDSLRLLINPERIYVEIAPKDGAFLSPSQTIGVVEGFFRARVPSSFSYMLIREEGNVGIALGTLVLLEGGRRIAHRVDFGFQKTQIENWLLSRIIIR